MIHIGLLIRCFDRLFVWRHQFIISGSSYTTFPDRLPILGRQIYLSQFKPVG